jgi:hypothetical protein
LAKLSLCKTQLQQPLSAPYLQLWIGMMLPRIRGLFYLSCGTGYISYHMLVNPKSGLMVTQNVAAFFRRFHYRVACGRVAELNG